MSNSNPAINLLIMNSVPPNMDILMKIKQILKIQHLL